MLPSAARCCNLQFGMRYSQRLVRALQPVSGLFETPLSQGMNGKMVDGRALTVRVRSEAPAGPRRGLGTSKPEEELPPECKLYVGSLPHNVDEHALTGEFARFGPVVR